MLEKIKVYERKTGERIENFAIIISGSCLCLEIRDPIMDDYLKGYILSKSDPLNKFKPMEGWWFSEKYVFICDSKL